MQFYKTTKYLFEDNFFRIKNQTFNNFAKFVFSFLVDINSNKQGRYDF